MQIWNWFYTPHRGTSDISFHTGIMINTRVPACVGVRAPQAIRVTSPRIVFPCLKSRSARSALTGPVRHKLSFRRPVNQQSAQMVSHARQHSRGRVTLRYVRDRNSLVHGDCRSLWVWAASIGFFHSFPSIYPEFLNQREYMALVYEWFGSDSRCNQVWFPTTFTSTNETIPV